MFLRLKKLIMGALKVQVQGGVCGCHGRSCGHRILCLQFRIGIVWPSCPEDLAWGKRIWPGASSFMPSMVFGVYSSCCLYEIFLFTKKVGIRNGSDILPASFGLELLGWSSCCVSRQ